MAGASAIAIISFIGSIGKSTAKTTIKLTAEEAARVGVRAGAKTAMKHVKYDMVAGMTADIEGKIYSGFKFTEDGKFRYFLNGERRTPDKTIDFILNDGKLKFGKGHSYMSSGESVDYAGKIEFKSQDATDIDSWIPDSGHYKPSNDDITGQQMVKDAFKQQFGVDLPKMTPYIK